MCHEFYGPKNRENFPKTSYVPERGASYQEVENGEVEWTDKFDEQDGHIVGIFKSGTFQISSMTAEDVELVSKNLKKIAVTYRNKLSL